MASAGSKTPAVPWTFQFKPALLNVYAGRLAAGEALFSLAEAKLLDRHAGLRRVRDVLVFDPVHCYRLPGYIDIVDHLTSLGWDRNSFWPLGGHLFCLHVVAAMGLAGAELTPFAFYPFSGLFTGAMIGEGRSNPPDIPGIGFELNDGARRAFKTLT
ncbi:hypothetical protein [Rhizobium lusitanum]|uniref:L-alanine-DL-glutamate epimerase-like enolase superfamily enzyme n=1 Tax=Rhizobium lusitanum TaxID=293958 RepID=A0A7X0ISD4_9HYPH|nr:hypothetical protein [Rhizobium lusitanum]MBB6486288.1 L-alanine-DL-glutamate epimerase-like enolase superfamily enzyme [Rhizobium lusitanum]